ncbi:SubName: Full=Uncharacterized protein {ECO:0000313/EMBL:CCA74588.1} [Serendipita indica DSM 11827]|nr:SubName: Full=Uncharacterized protein {ECO:0000313/EMBL:CCA74588.1} [Serendipita indica DSM 11827]
MVNPDLSEPVSVLLRHGTKQAHEQAEHSPGAGWLTRGELDRSEYVRFLMMLHVIYSGGARRHQAHPVLKTTYNPSVLARKEYIALDIAYFLGADSHALKDHPAYLSFTSNMPSQVSAYVHRLRHISSNPTNLKDGDARLLLAHAYVRYLGDLSGGQFIRRRIAKVYNLPNTGEGVKFYTFVTSAGEGEAGMQEMKDLKDWYRDGMDLGVGDDHNLKGGLPLFIPIALILSCEAALVDEAILAFKLNQDLFTALRPPTHLETMTLPTSPNPSTTPPKLEPMDTVDKSNALTPSNTFTLFMGLLIGTVLFLFYTASSMTSTTLNA